MDATATSPKEVSSFSHVWNDDLHMDGEYIQQSTVHHEEVVMSSSFDVEESRRIRSEQDKEFAESLRIDQEKVYVNSL